MYSSAVAIFNVLHYYRFQTHPIASIQSHESKRDMYIQYYSLRHALSSFARKVEAVFNRHSVPYELVNVNTMDMPESYLP